MMSGAHIERLGGLAILRLDKARGNAIDEPLADDLVRTTAELADDASVRGVLLASAHPKLFCPGLDLVALLEYDRMAMQRFVSKFGQAVLGLFTLRKPVVAAVAGHAVAGGCVLALTSDHRVLRRGSQIGLNEVRVGIPLPWSVAILLKNTIASHALSRVALLGLNFKDEEAVALGLGHEVVEAEGFEDTCLARLQEFADRDPAAVGTTKAYLRDAALREMRAQDAAREGEFLDAWFSPAGRAKIKETVNALTQKG
jgi:enoyl-CoA hydratase/carnithine racemase